MKKVICASATTKCLALILSAIMIVGLTSCSKPITPNSSSETSKATISIWFPTITAAGIQNNPISREITKATGVTMNIVTGDSSKFKTLMATGDLPDVICANFASENVVASAIIKSGQLLSLDSIISKDAPSIAKDYASALDYSKKFLSNGENKLYFIPSQVYNANAKNPDVSQYGNSVGYMVKWDVYAKAGYPKINTTDDFLNVLQQMQNIAPAVDGKKVYAFSGWTDWGIWPWYLPYICDNGSRDAPNDLIINTVDGTASNLYDNSLLWDSLKFYNKASGMGLIDPDAFTMKYSDFLNKQNAGQVLVTYGSFLADLGNAALKASGHPDQGYETINAGLPYKLGIYTSDAPLGTGVDWSWAINKNCKNVEAALRLLNFTYSDTGERLIYSGIKGTDWDLKNGVLSAINHAGADYNATEGLQYYSLTGCSGSQILSDGFPASVNNSNEIKASNATEVDKQFCSYYGSTFKFPGQVLQDMANNNKVLTTTKFWPFSVLIDSPTDADTSTLAKVDQYMQIMVAKIIMAKSDADFDSLVAQAKAGIKGLGYDKVATDLTALIKKAQQDASTLNLK